MTDVGPTLTTTAPVRDRFLDEFHALAALELNLRPLTFAQAAADPAWNVDHSRDLLAREAPGPPEPHGVYVTARQALIDYAFADPRLVRAVYDAAVPLEGRDMLLVGRFYGLRFPMGVRVSGVADGPDERDGRPVHRFAWHYSTLEGHLERGEMQYELLKWTDTGDVELQLHAYSQGAGSPNPIVRLGFAIFGRWMQQRFYDRVLSRVRELVDEPSGARS